MRVNSGFQLCATLTATEKCIRLREYKQGAFHDLFHEHVKAGELADSVIPEVLRTLVLRYEEASAAQIVQSYLTQHGRAAKADHHLEITVEYPESGVIWRCCGGNVQAWIDSVIGQDFRKT